MNDANDKKAATGMIVGSNQQNDQPSSKHFHPEQPATAPPVVANTQYVQSQLERLLLEKYRPAQWIEYMLCFGKTRWFEAEERILARNDSFAICEYACHVLQGRWLAAERRIRGWKNRIEYARRVIGARWPELEDALLHTAPYSVRALYAKRVIKGRWKEIEAGLLLPYREPAACKYAKRVIGGRWAELERMLLRRRGKWAAWYARNVIADKWPALESRLLEKRSRVVNGKTCAFYDVDSAIHYCTHVIQGRWPKLETILLKDNGCVSPENLYRYAAKVIQGRLPDQLHNRMVDEFACYLPNDYFLHKYLCDPRFAVNKPPMSETDAIKQWIDAADETSRSE